VSATFAPLRACKISHGRVAFTLNALLVLSLALKSPALLSYPEKSVRRCTECENPLKLCAAPPLAPALHNRQQK
jgi:hypothetical protein